MFCGNDNRGRVKKIFPFERSDHLPDRCIHELDFGHHFRSGSTLGVLITASVCVGSDSGFGFNQLLSNADRLVVHAKNYWDGSLACTEVRSAVDLVEHGVDLQLIVALDGVEIGGPVIAIGNKLAAVKTISSRKPWQHNLKRVNLRGIVIIQ